MNIKKYNNNFECNEELLINLMYHFKVFLHLDYNSDEEFNENFDTSINSFLHIFYDTWSGGGDWKDCWGGGGDISPEDEPEKTEYFKFLKEFFNIPDSDLDSFDIFSCDHEYESDYYGGSTTKNIRHIYIPFLIESLFFNKIIDKESIIQSSVFFDGFRDFLKEKIKNKDIQDTYLCNDNFQQIFSYYITSKDLKTKENTFKLKNKI